MGRRPRGRDSISADTTANGGAGEAEEFADSLDVPMGLGEVNQLRMRSERLE